MNLNGIRGIEKETKKRVRGKLIIEGVKGDDNEPGVCWIRHARNVDDTNG